MIAPMPSSVRSNAVSVRRSALPPCSASPTQLLDRLRLEQIRVHSPSRADAAAQAARLQAGWGEIIPTAFAKATAAKGAGTLTTRPAAPGRRGRGPRDPASPDRRSPRPRSRRRRGPPAPARRLMPPIATTGTAPARAAARRTRSRPDRRIAGVLRRGAEDRSDGEVRDRLAKRRLDLLGGVRREADDRSARRSPRSAAASTSSCPTWTPAAPPIRATSARSLTMTPAVVRTRRAHQALDEPPACDERPGARSLGAQLDADGAPPSEKGAREIRPAAEPRAARRSASTIAIEPARERSQAASASGFSPGFFSTP